MAVSYRTLIHYCSKLAAGAVFSTAAESRYEKVDLVFVVKRTIVAFCGCAASYVIASRLIIVGFSDELSDRLTRAIQYSRKEDFVWFLVIILLPCIIFYVYVIAVSVKVENEQA